MYTILNARTTFPVGAGRAAAVAPVALLAATLMAPLASLAALPALAAAQDADPEDARICHCDFDYQAPTMARLNRARLGVVLGDAVEADGRVGVRIADLTERSPAARAGLLPDDVILGLDGTELGTTLDDGPGERLIELMGDVEPGDTVEVRFTREGEVRTAHVVTDRMRNWTVRVGGGPAARFNVRPAPGLDRSVFFHSLFRDGLDLVEMNEGLGAYFGTTEGVLVAEAPVDSPLGLRSGDVLLRLDGRAVRDAAHVRAILDSYRADETIELRVMRDGREMTLEGRRAGR